MARKKTTDDETEAAPSAPAAVAEPAKRSKASKGPKTHVGDRKMCSACAGNGQKDGAACGRCEATGWHGGKKAA